MSYDLAKICTDAPVELDLAGAVTGNFFNEKSYPYFKKFNFKKYLDRFTRHRESAGDGRENPPCGGNSYAGAG